jgi:hypothetical protein
MADGLDEVEAMRKVAEALAGLGAPEVKRVLRWANDKYGHVAPPPEKAAREPSAEQPSSRPNPGTELGELFSSASPQTEADRALVVAYWMQEIRGDDDIDAQSVNKELKHLGEGVANITAAFTKLIEQKPQLVIQTRKEGNTRQARKKYKVTAAGKRAVQKLLSEPAEG